MVIAARVLAPERSRYGPRGVMWVGSVHRTRLGATAPVLGAPVAPEEGPGRGWVHGLASRFNNEGEDLDLVTYQTNMICASPYRFVPGSNDLIFPSS